MASITQNGHTSSITPNGLTHSPPPTYQPPAKWGKHIPEGVRAMNTSSSVVTRYFRGQNEHMKIAGPGEVPNIPISQQQLQSVPSSSSPHKQKGKLDSLVPANESEWDRDMRLIKENEYWEGRIVDIANDLQERYRDKFKDMGVTQKIGVFKMLEYFHWNYVRSMELLQILEKTPNDLVMNMVGMFQVFETKERYLDTGIDFFVALNQVGYRYVTILYILLILFPRYNTTKHIIISYQM